MVSTLSRGVQWGCNKSIQKYGKRFYVPQKDVGVSRSTSRVCFYPPSGKLGSRKKEISGSTDDWLCGCCHAWGLGFHDFRHAFKRLGACTLDGTQLTRWGTVLWTASCLDWLQQCFKLDSVTEQAVLWSDRYEPENTVLSAAEEEKPQNCLRGIWEGSSAEVLPHQCMQHK